jgi:two-component system sensor kinase FixL
LPLISLSRLVSDLKLLHIYGSDITERKQSEEQMSQLRSELLHSARAGTMGELTAALAHELNHPLGSILNNANAARRYLEQDNPDLDEIREIVADIISEDRRASEVMQKVRDLMKKTEAGFAPVKINSIIEEVIKLTQSDEGWRG